jgi:hypothetical protein
MVFVVLVWYERGFDRFSNLQVKEFGDGDGDVNLHPAAFSAKPEPDGMMLLM